MSRICPSVDSGPAALGRDTDGGEQVAGRPGAHLRHRREAIEDREILLGVVDSIDGIGRRGPTELGCSYRCGSAGKLSEIGEPTLGGPQGFQRVERRHARPSLVEIETGIGETDLALGCAGRKCQRETLTFEPALVRHKAAANLLAQDIEQDRLLDDSARKHLFGEAWQEYGFEAQPPGSLDWANEDPPIALRRRWDGHFQQTTFQDDENFTERDRTNRRHPGHQRRRRGLGRR